MFMLCFNIKNIHMLQWTWVSGRRDPPAADSRHSDQGTPDWCKNFTSQSLPVLLLTPHPVTCHNKSTRKWQTRTRTRTRTEEASNFSSLTRFQTSFVLFLKTWHTFCFRPLHLTVSRITCCVCPGSHMLKWNHPFVSWQTKIWFLKNGETSQRALHIIQQHAAEVIRRRHDPGKHQHRNSLKTRCCRCTEANPQCVQVNP